jgi:hypothetical protein
MNGRSRDDGRRERDSREPAKLYSAYVQFERRSALAELMNRNPGWERDAFNRDFEIMSKKQFEEYFQSLGERAQRQLVKRWSLGYERYIEKKANQLIRDLRARADQRKEEQVRNSKYKPPNDE